MKENVDSIFKYPNGIEFSLVIENQLVQCTAYSPTKDKATIFIKPITQESSTGVNDIANKKRTEERLELVDFVFKHVNTAIHFVNQDGTFYDFNEALCNMLGYTQKEFSKLKIFDLNTYITKEYWTTRWYFLKEHNGIPLYIKLKKKDGSIIDVEMITQYVNYSRKELICTFLKDITEKKRVDERLELVDFIFRKTAVCIFITREDATFYDFNQAVLDLYGYSKEEMKALKVDDLTAAYHKEDVPKVWADLWVRLKKQKSITFNSKHKKKDGEIIDVEIRVNHLVYGGEDLNCAFITDITEKKRANERLELVDFAFRNASIPMHFIDRVTGDVYDCNEASCSLLGYTKEEYKNLTIFDISTRQTPETWVKRWEYLKSSVTNEEIIKIRRKDKTLVDVELRTDVFKFGDKELGFSSFIDITEKKKLEEQLKMVDFAFRNASTPMHFIDSTGAINDCNEAASNLLGYSMEDYKKLTVFDISLIQTSDAWSNRWDFIKKTNRSVDIFKMRRKDNSLIDIELRTDLFNYGDKLLAFSTFIDITERLKIDKQLKVVNHAFKTAELPMYFLREDGSIFDYNEAACNLLGYSKEEFGKLTMFDFSTRHTKETWKKRWSEMKAGQTQPITTRLRKKDGTLLDTTITTNLFEYGNIELTFTSLVDITEKLKLERQLRVVNHAFRNSSIPQHFLTSDGRIYDFNDAACKLLGYTNEEYRNISLFDFAPNRTPEIYKELFAEFKKGNVAPYNFKLRRKDKTFVDVEIRTDVFEYDDLLLNYVSFPEITDRIMKDEQLRLVDFVFRKSSTPILFVKDDGSLFSFNEAALDLYGYTEEEMRNIRVSDLDISDYGKDFSEVFKEVWGNLKDEGSFTFPVKHCKKDGTEMDLEINFNYIEYSGLKLNCAFITDVTEKKKLEKNLHIVDFSLRNATIAMVFLRKDGSIYDFNEAAHKLLGYTKEEYQSLTNFDISTKYITPKKWAERFEEIRRGPNTPIIMEQKKKDNSVVFVEIRSEIIVYEDLELCFSSIIDITQKLKAEEANHKERKLLRTLIDHLPFSIFVKDNEARKLVANQLDIEYMGLTTEAEALGKTDLEIYGDTDRMNGYFEDMDVLTKGESIIDSDGKMISNDGKERDMLITKVPLKDEKGNVYGLIGIGKDVTEAKKLEERLKLLEKVVTETTQSVLIADATEGMGTPIIYANEAFSIITGYEVKEVIGLNPRLLHKGIDVQDEVGRGIIRKAIKNFVPWKVEVINTKKNGEQYWAEIAGFPVFDKNKGKYTHWVAIEADITKRKNAEAERETLLNELIENNKELVQFNFITMHNLRAPLTNLVSICNLFKTDKINDPLSLKFIEGFKTSTFHLNETLNDLISILMIKEKTNLTKDTIAFKEILEKVKSSLSVMLTNNRATIESDFSEAPTVKFTKAYLESIFLNLLTNSIRYSYPERPPIIKIKTTMESDGRTKLVFSDNGIGMNMEQVKHKIFGLYHRFHSNQEGKGLGLYLIHSQITTLGGTIDVDSKEGEGTTFTIHFI